MKTVEPKIIYLQIGEDVDISELKDYEFETNAITWCWERIHSNDIKYISKQSIIELIDEMMEQARHDADVDVGMSQYYILQELKQKIQNDNRT